jgi:hypothetical protein
VKGSKLAGFTIKFQEVTSMTLRVFVFSVFSFFLGAALFSSATPPGSLAREATVASPDNRDADRDAILSEIGRITQAFIDGDIETVYKTHSEDWSGFLFDNQQSPVVGIDAYMKAYGIKYPPPPEYRKPGPNPHPDLHYKVSDYHVTFVAPGVGVATFMLDYPRSDGVHFTRLRILDVFAKRDGAWLQVASYTATDPTWKAQQTALPLKLSPEARKQILDAREAVWRAYFSNDRAQLEKYVPPETIAINAASDTWATQADVLRGAAGFAQSGGKLLSLEFPRTEMQVYGNVVILYSDYRDELDVQGKRVSQSGRATEIFVNRDGTFVNVGWHLDAVK